MTKSFIITKLQEGQPASVEVEDNLAIEEPLEIRVQIEMGISQPISVTMRTPGNDIELALGFLFTEAIIDSKAELIQPYTKQDSENQVTIMLGATSGLDMGQLKRNFYTTSSCGVCGKESIESIKQVRKKSLDPQPVQVSLPILFSLPNRLMEAQQTFQSTGGIHAAALFDQEGKLDILREDVGRHNALDKLIGSKFLESDSDTLDLSKYILLLSGRASFELIQKASMAGIQVVCAIGAPSSLAVETAQEFEMTLIGFLKNARANVYCDDQKRIVNF